MSSGVNIRDESVVRNKAAYIALALDCEGHKHVLGIWIEQSEGAKFWLSRNRSEISLNP